MTHKAFDSSDRPLKQLRKRQDFLLTKNSRLWRYRQRVEFWGFSGQLKTRKVCGRSRLQRSRKVKTFGAWNKKTFDVYDMSGLFENVYACRLLYFWFNGDLCNRGESRPNLRKDFCIFRFCETPEISRLSRAVGGSSEWKGGRNCILPPLTCLFSMMFQFLEWKNGVNRKKTTP